ncbi:MAG TPA: response regulator [Stellaceae bacterium]|nr:response regulator [Stellaceae bacterium]
MSGPDSVNILLVDDQPPKLLSYEAILAPLGENLIKAGSANEALERLLKHEVAVVLIDVCMPDLDGFQLATMIREHPRFRSTAIIFVSAINVTDFDLLRGYELGAVDYVPVPVVPELLRAKVRVFAELYRKTRQLEALNAELESRVADRTAELARANAELEHRVEMRTREREEALAQVHAMQKLESLGQLTGGVAHDFNNLLMAVLGNLELLQLMLPGDRKIRRLLDGAIAGAERGAVLTKRLLAFARRSELKPEIVEIRDLVPGLIDMLRRSLGPGIEIVTKFHAGLVPTQVDPSQLELALVNLAVNSRDAMPLGGKLTIGARGEKIGDGDVPGLAAGEYIRIAVSDTGVGMDGDTLRRATEPFFTTKDRGRGTGLGLSMVDGFAAQSGGGMRIKSRPGAGTTVELFLPAAPRGKRAAPPPPRVLPPPIEAVRACRVLVVDDDPIVGAGTAAMLEDLGHAAIQAESAACALVALADDPAIDLVITDYAMPGMDGHELAARIHRDRPGLPVVVATGYAGMPPDGPKLPRLDKPYKQQELASVIARLVAPREPGRLLPAGAAAG